MSAKTAFLDDPQYVVRERMYRITYTISNCACDNCCRTKDMLATSYKDASESFRRMFLLAEIVHMERLG